LPDPLRTGAYRLEIISAALLRPYKFLIDKRLCEEVSGHKWLVWQRESTILVTFNKIRLFAQGLASLLRFVKEDNYKLQTKCYDPRMKIYGYSLPVY